MRGYSVDDGAGYDGADEGGGCADDVEEGEGEEFFAAVGYALSKVQYSQWFLCCLL